MVQGALSLALVVAIFVYALPRIADFSRVRAEIGEMTWLELATVSSLAVWNIITYWFVMVAALPGLTLARAMVVNQSSTAVSNTLPGGGAIGIGITYAMYTSYGFGRSEIALSVLVSGVWNNFVKLGMPVIALAILAVEGDASTAVLTAALAGVGALVGAVAAFAAILRSDELARRVGSALGRGVSSFTRLVRKPPVTGWGESAVRFRSETLDLVKGRWPSLTVASVISHISLYLVLLVTLRHIGVSDDEVGWAQVLAAFAFTRLISALPITPGGLGVVELALGGALVAWGGDRSQVVASVLVWRALTYALPIPVGAVTYLVWRRRSGANRRPPAREDEPPPPPAREVVRETG
ncbi:hypothetical protein BH24ACT26_BH24ACT26_01390 [soil metagenome]